MSEHSAEKAGPLVAESGSTASVVGVEVQPETSSSCCSGKATSSKPTSASAEAPVCCASKVSSPNAPPLVEPKAASSAGWKAYTPLLVILTCVTLSALALQLAMPATQRSMMAGMSQFMGLFLVIFAMLKLFDLPGFVNGFARYDLLAGAVRPYGYLYPLLELGFGLALLAQVRPFEVNLLLSILMFFGAAGVLRSLQRGENLRCACMGSALNVPLSTVAVVEDVGMGVMCLVMLGMLP